MKAQHFLSLFLVTALCGSVLSLCAQTQTPALTPKQPSRWSIALTAGAAIPVGSFAGIHNPSSSGTSVSVGPAAEIAGAYRIWHFLSAVLVVNGQLNHGNGIPADLTNLIIYKIGAYHQGALAYDWQLTRVLAGGALSLPLTKHDRLSLQFRALAGTQKTRTPVFAYVDPRIEVAQGYSNVLRASAETLASVFSYQLDAGIRYSLRGKWALLAYGGYNGCQPFRYPNLIPGGPPWPLEVFGKHKLPTGTLGIRMGVELTL